MDTYLVYLSIIGYTADIITIWQIIVSKIISPLAAIVASSGAIRGIIRKLKHKRKAI